LLAVLLSTATTLVHFLRVLYPKRISIVVTVLPFAVLYGRGEEKTATFSVRATTIASVAILMIVPRMVTGGQLLAVLLPMAIT